jgi:pheromone a factor receptor
VFCTQDARFIIFEDVGCYPLSTASWVSFAIGFVPPVLLELISGVYGCLSIRAFYKHHFKLKDSECLSHQNLNPNHRYIRLMLFSACDLLVGTPITVFYLYCALPLFPLRRITERDYSRVPQVPAVLWRATTIRQLHVELSRWIMVFCAFIYFAIFGFTQESRNNYRATLRPVVQVFIMITGIKIRPSSKAEECVLFFFLSSCFPSDTPNTLIRITFKPASREPDTVNSNVLV